MNPRREPLSEIDKVGIMLGIAVARRFKQRLREFGTEWPTDGLVALAVSDIWSVMSEAEGDVMHTLDEYLSLEESLTGGGG